MKLNEITDNPGASQGAHARRPRHRLRQGQAGRARRQGPEGALRRAHQGLRRRPDAAASAPAQARLHNPPSPRDLNEVNLGRVQKAIDAGKLDAGQPVTVEALVAAGVMRPRARRRQDPRQGRTQGQARRSKSRRVEERGRGDREGRRLGQDCWRPKPAAARADDGPPRRGGVSLRGTDHMIERRAEGRRSIASSAPRDRCQAGRC